MACSNELLRLLPHRRVYGPGFKGIDKVGRIGGVVVAGVVAFVFALVFAVIVGVEVSGTKSLQWQ